MLEPTPKLAPARFGGVPSKRLGTIRPSAPAVFIYETVLEEILSYSEADTSREIGGFLLGGLHIDPELSGPAKRFVEVRRFLPAQDTHGQGASLRFTHDTWSALHRQVEELHPDEKLIGWQHTHPGLGVFFSGYDRFIHRNFFAEPSHIALVVDPIQQELEFFQWVGDAIEDCGFYCVRDSQGGTPAVPANQ